MGGWMNPLTAGVALGVFVLYPYLLYRDGPKQIAVFWTYGRSDDPVSGIKMVLGHFIEIYHAAMMGGVFGGLLVTPVFLFFGWEGF